MIFILANICGCGFNFVAVEEIKEGVHNNWIKVNKYDQFS